ncbi:two-component system chemotaxis response regulator CheB [Variovorax sp. GrIS 2.14]|uniref:chemotaxis protein CheB n=1 Tax=Variovorax sp. GrIS 2.14 TaxID=3071709 RepID=UPI0038F69524
MDLIVVGGSFGALDVLRRLVSVLPAAFEAPIAVVLHSHPDSPMALADILGKSAEMPVSYAAGGQVLQPAQIYIAPPDRHLVIRSDATLGLDSGTKVRHARPAANRLFESAAKCFGARVIGVVLSDGDGDGDGTDGLIAIKAHQGLSIVQSPSDALAPSMPTQALLHDSPDHVVLIEELGPLLISLVQQRAVWRHQRSAGLARNHSSPGFETDH